ncbi:hypothetical protein M569_07674, partial [Genlisea aurea]
VTTIQPTNEPPTVNLQEAANPKVESSHQGGGGWLKKSTMNLENSITSLPGGGGVGFNSNDRDNTRSSSNPRFDELDGIIKVKLAEADMYQSRADDARRESEALKRIAVSKSERIEEEYSGRISKLRLPEAEEMRKQKFDELQGVERAYQEYFNMKMRMETDIKDLLLKMEAKRRNLAM